MGKIICFSNQKGGVGKTTSAVNLSAAVALAGLKTLVVDIDPQSNCTSGLGIDRTALNTTIYDCLTDSSKIESAIIQTEIEKLSVIASNAHLAACELELIEFEEREFVLKKRLAQIAPNFDLIMIDCPPSLGLLTVNALAASDLLFIPLQCEYYALEGLGQLMSTVTLVKEKLNPSLEIIGVLMTMADFRTNLTQQVIAEVKKYFGERVFQTVISRSVRVSEAPSYGKPLILYDPSSKSAKAYQEAARELMKRLGVASVTGEIAAEAGETAQAGAHAEAAEKTTDAAEHSESIEENTDRKEPLETEGVSHGT